MIIFEDMKDKIIILGSGGHAKVLIDMIRVTGDYDIIGILDPAIESDSHVLGIRVLGNDSLLPKLFEEGVNNACIGVGSVRDNYKRKSLFQNVKSYNFAIPLLLHPKAIISENAQVSEGAQIMAGAIVQAGTSVGENTIINTGAIIEHDCKISRHVHICPGVVVSGGCIIEEGSFIGTGSAVIQGITIGKNSLIAAGSVVVKDVPEGVMVKGVPAK